MPAACKLNHPPAVKLDARSLAGYARKVFVIIQFGGFSWSGSTIHLYIAHHVSHFPFHHTPPQRRGACD